MENQKNINYLTNTISEFLKTNSETGFLTFQVTTAQGNIPVENARISISIPLGNDYHIAKILYSDESGKTAPFPLPAPDSSLSNTPGNKKPYSEYNVSATADGYNTVQLFNVPVFEGINSIQPINLLPVFGGENETVFEEEPSNL